MFMYNRLGALCEKKKVYASYYVMCIEIFVLCLWLLSLRHVKHKKFSFYIWMVINPRRVLVSIFCLCKNKIKIQSCVRVRKNMFLNA